MPRFNADWKVASHGPLETLDDGLLTVAGEIAMPLGNFPRRMTVMGLSSSRTAIWSAIPLREALMRKIEALGAPSFLIVPGVGHRLDVAAWKKRYPDARVVCGPGARKEVEKVTVVDLVRPSFDDDTVSMHAVPGTADKELGLMVRRSGLTLVVNDILANVRHPHGFGAHVMARLMGFGVSRPKVPWLGKRLFVKDRPALAAWLRKMSEEPDLARIVVSHGDVVSDQAAAVLSRAADEM
jgi:hypothetical protein